MVGYIFIACVSACLINTISACPTSLAASRLLRPTCSTIAPALSASGGGLAVVSSSPIAPAGISLLSQNNIEGILSVGGRLPFLGAVGFEGNFPSAGRAGVNYSCGNGQVGIARDSAGRAVSSAASSGGRLAGAGCGARAAVLARPSCAI